MSPIHAKIPVVVHRAEEGGYWAEVPSLPGCFSQAKTLSELRHNIQAAVDLYLAESRRRPKSPTKVKSSRSTG